MTDVYISLDEEDFRCLVRGGILQITDIKDNSRVMITLKDIGFHRMDKAIEDADKGIDIYKHRER